MGDRQKGRDTELGGPGRGSWREWKGERTHVRQEETKGSREEKAS